ncbi:hypothetical protein Y032_0538g3140 [Ancylostoma ceylanicum]|uniref:Uncharacterized protein n=1 Tax=Ancylostoma ceylanicum TaxID=53326 RepID=A0A016WT98_9BILA|nr:hypothetical protein Y032_0538g3140 [Ancylostoma ceylanicum]
MTRRASADRQCCVMQGWLRAAVFPLVFLIVTKCFITSYSNTSFLFLFSSKRLFLHAFLFFVMPRVSLRYVFFFINSCIDRDELDFITFY